MRQSQLLSLSSCAPCLRSVYNPFSLLSLLFLLLLIFFFSPSPSPPHRSLIFNARLSTRTSILTLFPRTRQSHVPRTSITFVSQASITSGTIATYQLRKRVEAVKNCRKIGKKDMKYNDVMPAMKVDPERYVSLLSSSLFSVSFCPSVYFSPWLRFF